MKEFICDISPTDKLHTYTTDNERLMVEHFAMVMEGANEQRVSVLLTREQAEVLGKQIQDFVVHGHKSQTKE